MWLFSAPYRVSIAGGGSDIPAWFKKDMGAVFGFATKQRLYGLAHPSFDRQWLVRYRAEEKCDCVEKINHDIIRESVAAFYSDCPPLEISCHGELPGHNTGLGASSAFSAGFCSLLLHLTGWREDLLPEIVALHAAKVELGKLKRDMGLQEIYTCSYGGANLLIFDKEGPEVYPLNSNATEALSQYVLEHCALIYAPEEETLRGSFKDFTQNIASVCEQQELTRASVCLAIETYNQINTGNTEFIYEATAAAWEIKKKNHATSSSGDAGKIVDELRDKGFAARLCGGGRGGFIFTCLKHAKDWDRLRSFCTDHSLNFRNTCVGLAPAKTTLLSTSIEMGSFPPANQPGSM
jgi:D-glycero-alpha-D-manno-heptose-7-phosphate kinase